MLCVFNGKVSKKSDIFPLLKEETWILLGQVASQGLAAEFVELVKGRKLFVKYSMAQKDEVELIILILIP